MPLYDFVCKNSGCTNYEQIDTVLLSHTEYDVVKDHTACPKCGKTMQRIYNNPPRAKFTGSGFYSTDYGKGTG